MNSSVMSFCRGAALSLCALALSVPAFATEVTNEGNGGTIQLASTETYHSVEPPDDADQWYVGSIPSMLAGKLGIKARIFAVGIQSGQALFLPMLALPCHENPRRPTPMP